MPDHRPDSHGRAVHHPRCARSDRPTVPARQFFHILVGDIWLLGGQSNMYGIDVVKEDLPAQPWLNMLNVRHVDRDAHWCAAVPPIHRIPEAFAAFTLKSQHPEYADDRIRAKIASGQPVGVIDCSYFFARKLHAESGVPIGLIPCAIGGSLSIWDPKGGDGNRYEFALHHVKTAGGRIKGLLFFQGEQDAIFGDLGKAVTKPSEIGPISTYGNRFARFIECLRGGCARSVPPGDLRSDLPASQRPGRPGSGLGNGPRRTEATAGAIGKHALCSLDRYRRDGRASS